MGLFSLFRSQKKYNNNKYKSNNKKSKKKPNIKKGVLTIKSDILGSSTAIRQRNLIKKIQQADKKGIREIIVNDPELIASYKIKKSMKEIKNRSFKIKI